MRVHSVNKGTGNWFGEGFPILVTAHVVMSISDRVSTIFFHSNCVSFFPDTLYNSFNFSATRRQYHAMIF